MVAIDLLSKQYTYSIEKYFSIIKYLYILYYSIYIVNNLKNDDRLIVCHINNISVSVYLNIIAYKFCVDIQLRATALHYTKQSY